jgi:fructose 1,6-bisphosphate aldolase/phosphatase
MDVIRQCRTVAGTMKLHASGKNSPLVGAEMEFSERKTEPVLIFLSAGTGPGVWNQALYRIFADPFTTEGRITGPAMHPGFDFEVQDIARKQKITFSHPEEARAMLSCIGDTSRFIVRTVRCRDGVIAATAGAPLHGKAPGPGVGAGEYDSVMIVRCQDGLPSTGEALEPFCTPLLVNGPAGCQTYGPLMPVGVCDATMTRSVTLSRCTCLGFQLNNGGLVGPADMFDDPAFERARSQCSRIADILRAQGPFLPSFAPARIND